MAGDTLQRQLLCLERTPQPPRRHRNACRDDGRHAGTGHVAAGEDTHEGRAATV